MILVFEVVGIDFRTWMHLLRVRKCTAETNIIDKQTDGNCSIECHWLVLKICQSSRNSNIERERWMDGEQGGQQCQCLSLP